MILPAASWAYDDLNRRRFYLVGSETVFARVAGDSGEVPPPRED